MILRPIALACATLAPFAATADAALLEALQLPRVVEVMRAEGLAQGEELAADLLPGRDPAAFMLRVERIYDAAAMERRLSEGLTEALADADVPAIRTFFEGEVGARIIDLELSAREAMMDEDVEEAAKAGWAEIAADDPDRAALIDEFIEVNGLVDENVQGGLNSNLSFFRGMNAGGAFDPPMDESAMLADIWGQEPEIRAETTDWLHGYLGLAYAPLAEAELEEYVAFSRTEAGRDLNRALFDAFDEMYDGVTFALGESAALLMSSEDI